MLGLVLGQLCSCRGIQKGLIFNLLAPKGGDGLTFVTYADDSKHVSFKSSKDVYNAFFSTEYEAIIFDIDKGLDIIGKYHLPYKLARVNTYGNCYLLGLNKDAAKVKKQLSSLSNIISYNYGEGVLRGTKEDNYGIQNKIFNYDFGSLGDNNLIDLAFSDLEDEYQYLLTASEEEVDYCILPEPYASRLIKENSSYSLMMSLVSEYKSKISSSGISDSGYSHFPQTGFFVSSSWDEETNNDKKDHITNFFESYDNMTTSLERSNGSRVVEYLDSAVKNKTFDPKDYFGNDNESLYTCLNGSENPNGVNALGFCSYPVDLESYYVNTAKIGLRVLNSSLVSSCFSKYYNNVGS